MRDEPIRDPDGDLIEAQERRDRQMEKLGDATVSVVTALREHVTFLNARLNALEMAIATGGVLPPDVRGEYAEKLREARETFAR